MMYQTISLSRFREEFARMGRADQFSYDALAFIFDYLEDSASDVALDVIELCCEFSETPAKEIAKEHDIDLSDCECEQDIIGTVVEYLDSYTHVLGATKRSIVYANF
jgi:hypothetical protein